METLFERIFRKCAEGIPYHEAVQLTLWVYCTLDVLPTEFHGVTLSRRDLCVCLSRLGAVGKIIVESKTAADHEQFSHDDIAQPEHWDALVAKFLRKELSLDDTFPTRIRRYI
jgi:hypothetical protein